jgi:hypothetical protein
MQFLLDANDNQDMDKITRKPPGTPKDAEFRSATIGRKSGGRQRRLSAATNLAMASVTAASPEETPSLDELVPSPAAFKTERISAASLKWLAEQKEHAVPELSFLTELEKVASERSGAATLSRVLVDALRLLSQKHPAVYVELLPVGQEAFRLLQDTTTMNRGIHLTRSIHPDPKRLSSRQYLGRDQGTRLLQVLRAQPFFATLESLAVTANSVYYCYYTHPTIIELWRKAQDLPVPVDAFLREQSQYVAAIRGFINQHCKGKIPEIFEPEFRAAIEAGLPPTQP